MNDPPCWGPVWEKAGVLGRYCELWKVILGENICDEPDMIGVYEGDEQGSAWENVLVGCPNRP